jgi:integrase
MEFRESMENSNLSKNTISIHLRNIRTVFNYAIKKLQVASLVDYPFIDGDIQGGLKTAYKSRALTLAEVNSIRDYRLKQDINSDLWHACNIFIFGYVGRGINFVDIARLKWDNYKSDRIYFTRRKTRSKISEETNFPVTPELKEILRWYRKNNMQLGNTYIFPILNGNHKTEKSIRNKTEKARTELNSLLKKIGVQLSIVLPITTYVWRHSFSNVAKNDLKVDVSMISEMLGHHDLQTTKHYLKSFPDSDLDAATANM